mgnify:CR=1 FL=1
MKTIVRKPIMNLLVVTLIQLVNGIQKKKSVMPLQSLEKFLDWYSRLKMIFWILLGMLKG